MKSFQRIRKELGGTLLLFGSSVCLGRKGRQYCDQFRKFPLNRLPSGYLQEARKVIAVPDGAEYFYHEVTDKECLKLVF